LYIVHSRRRDSVNKASPPSPQLTARSGQSAQLVQCTHCIRTRVNLHSDFGHPCNGTHITRSRHDFILRAKEISRAFVYDDSLVSANGLSATKYVVLPGRDFNVCNCTATEVWTLTPSRRIIREALTAVMADFSRVSTTSMMLLHHRTWIVTPSLEIYWIIFLTSHGNQNSHAGGPVSCKELYFLRVAPSKYDIPSKMFYTKDTNRDLVQNVGVYWTILLLFIREVLHSNSRSCSGCPNRCSSSFCSEFSRRMQEYNF
jgi:hypothetical protein